jgi:hypothetical protein
MDKELILFEGEPMSGLLLLFRRHNPENELCTIIHNRFLGMMIWTITIILTDSLSLFNGAI